MAMTHTPDHAAGITTYEVMPVSYDMAGAALATGLSQRELRRAIAVGDLIVHYRGTKPLILRDELLEFVRSLPTERKR